MPKEKGKKEEKNKKSKAGRAERTKDWNFLELNPSFSSKFGFISVPSAPAVVVQQGGELEIEIIPSQTAPALLLCSFGALRNSGIPPPKNSSGAATAPNPSKEGGKIKFLVKTRP